MRCHQHDRPVYNKRVGAIMLNIASTIKLSNGTAIPRLGLGVWQIPDGEPIVQAVTWALEAGYRHIDTAKIYRNEAGVGQAIRDSAIPREAIWVTTKLWSADQLNPMRAFEESRRRLGLDYVDLYLVHWPVPGLVKRTWKHMEAIYATGKCKAIGVSNHSISQLQDILSVATVPPAVNQVKCSPFDFDQDVYNFCQQNKIAVEAYSPLTRGQQLSNETLQAIARKYHKSAAQILIRWALQKDMIVIPKSSQQQHILENANVFDFEISAIDMATLDKLSA
jgi:methylglyoxal/glyoxal reductase